jgi:hypothetical protein
MPEEEIETAELKDSVDESVERALEVEREKSSWITYLSLSTAIIAVFAAVASLESGANSNDAILEKNDAILEQSRASDQWALYQAKNMRAVIASEFALSNAELAQRFDAEAARLKEEQAPLAARAREHERSVEEHNVAAQHLLARHHRFAVSVTLFQIAVALSAISALTKKKPLWLVALAGSAIGLALFIAGLLAPL